MLQDIIGCKKELFADGVQTVLRGHENRNRRVVLLKGNLVQNARSESAGINARVNNRWPSNCARRWTTIFRKSIPI